MADPAEHIKLRSKGGSVWHLDRHTGPHNRSSIHCSIETPTKFACEVARGVKQVLIKKFS